VIALNRSTASRHIKETLDRPDRFFPFVGLPLHVVVAGSLLLLVIRGWPSVHEALNVTALTAGLIFAGYTLLRSGTSETHAPSSSI